MWTDAARQAAAAAKAAKGQTGTKAPGGVFGAKSQRMLAGAAQAILPSNTAHGHLGLAESHQAQANAYYDKGNKKLAAAHQAVSDAHWSEYKKMTGATERNRPESLDVRV